MQYIWNGFQKLGPINLIAGARHTFSTAKAAGNKENRKNEEFDYSKARLLVHMNFKDNKHAVPFMKLPISTLVQIIKTTKLDASSGFTTNRLYYLAERIKCPVSELSDQVAKRTFIYTLSPDWLKSTLDVLLDMGVPGERIAGDLWVLKYHADTVRSRLEIVTNAGVTNLHPWMVRCPMHTLTRFIELANEPKNILGHQSLQTYLANRLDTTPQQIEETFVKVPALRNTRVTKIKRFIDYLLKEGFTKQDIATKLRVVTASYTTVKQRIEILRNLGVENINLNLLVRSQTDFDKITTLLGSYKFEKHELEEINSPSPSSKLQSR